MKAAALSSPTLDLSFNLCPQAAFWLPFARLLPSGEVKAASPEGVPASAGALTSRYTVPGQREAQQYPSPGPRRPKVIHLFVLRWHMMSIGQGRSIISWASPRPGKSRSYPLFLS